MLKRREFSDQELLLLLFFFFAKECIEVNLSPTDKLIIVNVQP